MPKGLSFVLLWIAAGLWFPLLAALVLPPSTPANGFWPGLLVGWATLPVAGLSQSLLLIGRVRAPLLWLAAAILADVVGHVLFVPLLRLAAVLGDGMPPGSAALGAVILAMTIAVAGAQALAIRYWRLGGWQWLAIAFVAHLLANALAWAVSSTLLQSLPPRPAVDPEHLQTLQLVIQTLVQWLVFGGVMGSWLWRCLHRGARAPAR